MKVLALLSTFLAITSYIRGCQGGTTKTVICSRIISVKEKSESDKVKLEFGGKDPIGCQNHYGDKLLRDGLHASKCEESWIDLKDGASSFARSINLLDRSGSLTVFRTGVKDGSQVRNPLCFRHDVPMGGGKFADDSPRCFNPNGGAFLMFLARTCSNGWCATYWLTAVEGKCDGTKHEPELKMDEQNDTSEKPQDESSGGDQKQRAQDEKRAKSDSKDSKNSESSKGNSDKEDAKKDATPAGDSLTKKLADLGRVPLPPQTGK